MEKPFEQKVLDEFRQLLFAKIIGGVITGYNIYHHREEIVVPYRINYLHSDLGVLPSGKRHPHFEELSQKLNLFGPQKIQTSLAHSIVDRVALYKIGDWRDNPEELIYFDEDGNRLDSSAFEDYDGILVVEGVQFDLSIDVSSERDLNKIISILNRYTYRLKTTRSGNITSYPNSQAISSAWDIPLITISTKHDIQRKDFVFVRELSIIIDKYEGITLTGNPQAFKNYLKGIKQHFSEKLKLVNKPFVISYLQNPL